MRYRMFTELILTGTMLLTGACQKEKGYTGFMKPSDGEETVDRQSCLQARRDYQIHRLRDSRS